MKLTNVTTMLKANAVKVLAATALAGAFLTAAAPAAQAQHFAVGVRIGGPVYAPAPAYYGRDYYGPRYVAPAPPVVYNDYDYGYGYGYDHGYYDHRDWRFDHRYDHRYDGRFDHRGWR